MRFSKPLSALSSSTRASAALARDIQRAGAPRRRARVVGAAVAPADSVDLVALWEEHVATEFTEKSADAAVATMVPHATVNHVPVMTGGAGTEALRRFYAEHFIPRMPPDVEMTPLHRVVGASSVVDEFLFEFTHTVRMDWMLPGLEPTGRRVSVPFVVVVQFEGDKLMSERIYWDQATVLVQLGLLPQHGLPVTGAEQAAKARDVRSQPSNHLMTTHLAPRAQ